MTSRRVSILVLTGCAALLGACDAGPAPDAIDRPGAGSSGKADAPTGSCAAAQDQSARCGGQGSGSCWCDAQCLEYGDCCADAGPVCGIEACEEAQGEGTVACPAGWRLAANNAGLAFCLREDLPATAHADCSAFSQGVVGYVVGYDDPGGSSCPADAEASTDADGLHCAFGVDAPPGAQAYCGHLDHGVLGYYWDACAGGMSAALGPDGEQRCVFSPPTLPVGARDYCAYIDDGVFGYYWRLSDAPDYVCPTHTRFATNGVGTGFCLLSYAQMPGNVRSVCDADAASIGYAWNVGCGS